MRTELFIENYKADLTAAESTRINKSINDIRELNKKSTAYTRTITLPGTPTNNRIFGHVYGETRDHAHNGVAKNVNYNYSPARSAKCILYNDSFVAVRGVIRLLNVIRKGKDISYECTVYGELGGFIGKLGENHLTDLDFSTYDHDWTIYNIGVSWINIGTGAGVFYPLIDYGVCSFDKVDFNVNSMRPAFYMKEFVDKIFQLTGYTYDCPFFNSTFFKRLIIPNNESDFFKVVSELLNRTVSGADVASWSTFGFINSFSSSSPRLVPFSNGTLANFTPAPAFDSFAYSGVDTALCNCIFNVSGTWIQFTNLPLTLEVVVNNVVVHQQQSGGSWQNNGTSQPFSFSNPSGFQLLMHPGDVVFIRLKFANLTAPVTPGGTAPIAYITSGSLIVDSVGAQAAPMDLGDPVKMNHCIPKNIRVYDFLDTVINMFNLHIVEDKQTEKLLVIRPYVQFYQTTGTSRINWTEKIDRAEEVTLTPMGELTSRLINFQYEKDTDYWNETYQKRRGRNYGDKSKITGYEFGDQEKNIKLIFAGSPLVAEPGLDKVVTAIYKKDSNGEQRTGSKVRVLQCKIKPCTFWEVMNWVKGFGSIESATNSNTINGTNTIFTSQATIGAQIISKGKLVGVVQSVTNNATIVLTGNASIAVSGDEFYFATMAGGFTQYPYAGHLDDPNTPTSDLNFEQPAEVFYSLSNPYTGNNLYTAYWEHYINEILNPKSALMSCFVKLTPADIFNLDFSRYIQVDGALYRLNKVIDYDTEHSVSTKTELLKVINPLT